MKISSNSAFISYTVVSSNNRVIQVGDGSNSSLESIKRSSPLLLLTQNIVEIYKKCNGKLNILDSRPQRILTNPSLPSSLNNNDNVDGNLIVKVNDAIDSPKGYKYSVVDLLGVGTFGQVFRCCQEKTRDYVAIKVIKNIPAYHSQGQLEIKIINLLNSIDTKNQRHIIRLLDFFEFKNHICLVFELLHSSLLDILSQNQYRGLPLTIVQRIARQLLISLVTLQDANIIHCDIKPENILIIPREVRSDTRQTRSNNNSSDTRKKSDESDSSSVRKALSESYGPSVFPDVKLIDFGSACYEGEAMFSYIQSRFYRAPEVLLGVPYNGAIDLWSFACVCVELYLGLPLFPGVSQHNQLSRIIDMFGLPPSYLISIGKNTSKYFVQLPNSLDSSQNGKILAHPNNPHQGTSNRAETPGSGYTTISASSLDVNSSSMNGLASPIQYRLKTAEEYARYTNTDVPVLKKYLRYSRLEDVIMKNTLPGNKVWSAEQKQEEYLRRQSFHDFLNGLFRLNPFERWTAKQAASHPFITNAPFITPFQPPTDPKISERKASFINMVEKSRAPNSQTSPSSNQSSIPRPIQQQGALNTHYNQGMMNQTSNLYQSGFLPLDRRRLSDPSNKYQPQELSGMNESTQYSNLPINPSSTDINSNNSRPFLKRGQAVLPRKSESDILQSVTSEFTNSIDQSELNSDRKVRSKSMTQHLHSGNIQHQQLQPQPQSQQQQSLHYQSDSYQQIISQKLHEKQHQYQQLAQASLHLKQQQAQSSVYSKSMTMSEQYMQKQSSSGWTGQSALSEMNPYSSGNSRSLSQDRTVMSQQNFEGDRESVSQSYHSSKWPSSFHNQSNPYHTATDRGQSESHVNAHSSSYSFVNSSTISGFGGGSMQEGRTTTMMTDFGHALLRSDVDISRRFQSVMSGANQDMYHGNHQEYSPVKSNVHGMNSGYQNPIYKHQFTPSNRTNYLHGMSNPSYQSNPISAGYGMNDGNPTIHSGSYSSSVYGSNRQVVGPYSTMSYSQSHQSYQSSMMNQSHIMNQDVAYSNYGVSMSGSMNNRQSHLPRQNLSYLSTSNTNYINPGYTSGITNEESDPTMDTDPSSRKISASYHDSLDNPLTKESPLITGIGFEYLLDTQSQSLDDSINIDDDTSDSKVADSVNEMDMVADWDPFFQTESPHDTNVTNTQQRYSLSSRRHQQQNRSTDQSKSSRRTNDNRYQSSTKDSRDIHQYL